MSGRSIRHRELLLTAEMALAGGALGQFRLPDEIAFIAESGQGARLRDVDGRSYLDFMLGYGALILGHAHPAVVEAVQRQAGLGSHFYVLTEPAIQLAEALLAAVPGAERVRFVNSGSDATFFALRLARAFTQRSKILKFEGGFHGTHDYAQQSVAARSKPAPPRAAPESAGIPGALSDTVLVAPFNDPEVASSLIAAHATDLAAVIVEPIQRCIPPRPGFLEALREVTRQHGVLLILDEVVTGFRLAYGGAQEYYGVQADLACYGKVLGGGYPLAAIAGRADVMALCDARRLGRADYAAVSSTLAGNPLAASAGLATLRELRRPGTYEQLHILGRRLRAGLESAGRAHGIPLRVIGEGPVMQALICESEPTNARGLTGVDWARTHRFGVEMVKRGVLLFRTAFLSTAHSETDVEQALHAANEVLDGLRTTSAETS